MRLCGFKQIKSDYISQDISQNQNGLTTGFSPSPEDENKPGVLQGTGSYPPVPLHHMVVMGTK